MKNKKLVAILILSTLAFFNAVYLTTQAFTLKTKLAASAGTYSSFCDLSDKFSCSNVLLAPAAQIFGVPFPAIAMAVYPIIFLVALFGYIGMCPKSFLILTGLSLGGILFNSYFIYQEAVNIGSFCPLCLICSAIILIIFGLSLSEVLKKKTL